MPDATIAETSKDYIELTRAAERLHRRFLDVVRTELGRYGIRDINTVQAMLLANIGDEPISMRELVDRGHYQPSIVSYHIRKLGDLGYLDLERSSYDKRAVNIGLTDKAREVVTRIGEIENHLGTGLPNPDQQIPPEELRSACRTLREVEQLWTDYIRSH